MNRRSFSVIRLFALTLPALITCQSVLAHEFTTNIGFEAEHTDNVYALGSNAEESETTLKPNVAIDYKLEYTAVSANLNYRLELENYQHDAFQDRSLFTGTTNLIWSVIDNRLTWSVYQNRSRLVLDRQQADTPVNDVVRSVIQTGPNLNFNLGSMQGTLSVLVADNSFDEGAVTDSSQTQYALNLSQQFAKTMTFGFFLQSSDVEFENNIPEYDSRRYGVSLAGTGKQLRYNFDIGRNETESGTQGKNTGLFYSAAITLEYPELSWMLTTNRELTDTNNGLSFNPNTQSQSQSDLGNGDGNFDNFDIVDRRRHMLLITSSKPKTSVSLGIFLDQQLYQTLPNDEETRGANLLFSYKASERITLSYKLQFEENELEPVSGIVDEYDQVKHRAQINYRPNTNLSFSAWVSLQDRNYGLPTRDDYKEVIVGTRIGYML